MKKMSLLAIGMCCSLLQPASAQTLTVNSAEVEACFASAALGDVKPVCIGAAADQCSTQAGGSTTLGTVACLQAELKVWDDLLNAEYKATRTYVDAFDQGDPPVSEALLQAQRVWIQYRDAECNLAYERYRGGTIRSIVASVCGLNLTAVRAIELRDMRGDGG